MAIALALLAVPMLGATAYAGEPGVCDTNKGTGKIDSFMQNTEPDGSGEWANGNMNGAKADLVEGDVVPQRVEMIQLKPGENELAFDYDVYVIDQGVKKWAYDYLTGERMEGGARITRWYVENADGPTAKVYVTFDVPVGVTTATLYYGAHIASELDHGAGSGAGSINGSPYHGGLVSLNCAASGANANQIMASAIDAGELTIVKDATPADGTDFHFGITPGGDASTFSLDDDSDATLPDRLTYRVAPGTYTVEELDIPAGWNLAGVTCSKTPSGSTATSRSVSLADDELVTCTFSNSKIAYKDLRVTNTATPSYSRDYDWTVDKSLVGPATRRIAEGQSAAVDYNVLVTPSAPKDSDFVVSGQIDVTNPNNVAVTGVTVSQTVPGATCTVSDGGTPLAGPVSIPGGGKSFTYRCTLGAGTGSTTAGTSTSNLTWPTDANYGTSGVAAATKEFSFAGVTPSTTDPSVTVTDSDFDLEGYTGGNVVRAEDGAKTFSYQLTWPGEPGVCKTYPNTATITEPDDDSQSDGARVEVCEGKDLTVSKTVVHSYYRTYDWQLSKVVVGPSTKEAGPDGTATFDYKVTATGGKATDSTWAMSGAITVNNPNAWPVTLSDVTDTVDVGGGASCAVAKGTDLVVAANSDRSFDYSCTFTSQPRYDGTNTATVTWDGTKHVSPHTSATGTADVVADRWKQADVDKEVTVIDDQTDPANPVTLGKVTWAGEGVSKDFTYSVSVRAGEKGQCVDYTNNAWIDELPAKKASAKVSVCAEADITVAKDATATYDTTYFWNITKDVDRFRAEVEPGGTGGFDYTVVAEPTTSRDSGWEMGGTITLTNPNAYKDVTVTLAAAYSGGGTCTPDSTTVVVPKASKTLVGYSCDFETQPDYGGTGTVTASWGGHQVQDTAKVPFKQDGQTDYKVDVYDDLTDPSASPKLLGQAVWDAAPENRTFRNHLDLAAAPGRCVDYTNTAWVDVTSNDISLIGTAVLPALDPFAQKTVTVCEKAGITVAQTLTATYDTTYLWDISKVADRSYAEVGSGAKARFDYTVVAEPNGSTDSNLRMSGKITLTNPNTFEDVTVDLADEYTGGGVCTPESTTVLVPRAGTAEVGYSCSFPTKPALSGTNTVTATWDGRTETVTAQVDFEQVGRTDYEVEVYDDLTNPQGTPKLLGRAVWDAPEENRTFTNSLDLGAASGQCVDYTNTAWVKVAQTRNPSDEETVTVCEQGALSVVKDVKASYDRTYLWDIEKTVTPRTAEIPAGAQQDFRYQVTALPKGYRDSGWEMTGTITVSNPNEFEPVEATLEDVYDNDTADPSDDVACEVTYPAGLDHLVVPQATKSGDAVTPGKAYATYACDFTSAPAYSGDNHVTVHWGDGQTDSFTKAVVFDEDQSVDKTVTVYDDEVHLQTPVALGEATWAWDDQTDEPVPTAFPTYTLSEEGVAGQCTDYTNTAYVDLTQPGVANPKASATATLCVEAAPAVTKTVEASFDRSYHWLIDKSVDNRSVEVTDAGDATFGYTVKATPNGSTDSGYTMGGTITVTNPNTYTGGAITTTVTDVPSVGGGATCTVAGGDNVTLAPEESRTLSYTCSFTSEPSHEGTDTATATWTGPDTRPHTSSTEEQPVSFRLDRETDRTVTVTDSLTDPSVLGTATWNAQGDPTPFTYSLVHKGTENRCVDYTNTATIRETQQSDSETVTLCDQGALVVTKTAEASYDRAYGWAITKVAERTRVDTAAGETGTVSYTVGVTPQGFVDSGWEMTGSVSVSNPNDYKDVTVELSDVPDLGEGATCDFDETQDFQVSAGETRTFGYTCDFTGKPAYDGSDTVRVDWAGGHVEATSQAPFELDQATNETVTVTDDLLDPSELGQVTWDETGKTTEFTYALGFEGKAGQCETVTNTATIVETGQAASADVDVCGANVIAPVEEERQPPVKPRPPFSPLPPEHAIKPRPPVEILPETGAPGGMGIWSTLGGLMLATGVALLLRRRKAAS